MSDFGERWNKKIQELEKQYGYYIPVYYRVRMQREAVEEMIRILKEKEEK